jgi:hypothetical protein
MSPYNLDAGIQKLLGSLTVAGKSITVAKAGFLPSLDLQKYPNGYVYWDLGDQVPMHNSEGLGSAGDGETVSFDLDIACIAHENAQRKAIVDAVLDILQPVVSGRRLQLTSHTIAGTGVFINYLRFQSSAEAMEAKTGQSNPDVTVIVLSFVGKATL